MAKAKAAKRATRSGGKKTSKRSSSSKATTKRKKTISEDRTSSSRAKSPGAKDATKTANGSAKKLRSVSPRKSVKAAAKSAKGAKGKTATKSTNGKVVRGAAPWVARHAAKRAEEMRQRNAEPPPPGSARATLRTPAEAERLKVEIAELHQLTSQLNALKKRVETDFYEIGEILANIQRKELYIAKGYASFEAFIDREARIPRSVCIRCVRIVHTFVREAAYDYDFGRLTMALATLDEVNDGPRSTPSSRSFSGMGLPPRPPVRLEE